MDIAKFAEILQVLLSVSLDQVFLEIDQVASAPEDGPWLFHMSPSLVRSIRQAPDAAWNAVASAHAELDFDHEDLQEIGSSIQAFLTEHASELIWLRMSL